MDPIDEPENVMEEIENDPQERARAYESVHNRLFVVRLFLTAALVLTYLFSGASAQLAEGLRASFDSWWVVNALYVVITMFGFSAFMFPLSLYADHTLEHHYELSNQTLASWIGDYLKALLLELVLMVLFFEVIYGLLRWSGGQWWLWATAFYVLFSVVMTAVAPLVIMPLFHKFELLEESDLTRAVKAFVEKAGLKVLGVFRWGLEEKTTTANAALAGLGRTRRIILGDTMLTGYTQEEIIAVLAHEVGHYKHRDLLRLLSFGTVLAAVGFYAVNICLTLLISRFGFSGIDDIGSFPIFVFCLFVFSLLMMPLSNGYSRKREFAADEFAVKAMGSAEALVRTFEKLADQNLSDKNPARWIEFLLHGHPSIARRIERARQVEKDLAS